jgi:hypothetical protein
MKLFQILLVTTIFLSAASGSDLQGVRAQMETDGRGEIEGDTGLRIRLDIKPASFSGSILFERDTGGRDSQRAFSLNVVRGEEMQPPSLTRSIQDRLKAMRIISRVALRLMEKAVLALL